MKRVSLRTDKVVSYGLHGWQLLVKEVVGAFLGIASITRRKLRVLGNFLFSKRVKMLARVSRSVRSRSVLSLSRTFVTKEEEKVYTTQKNKLPKNLADASTDVYLCCDINLVTCLTTDDVAGFPDYYHRILEDYPGELCISLPFLCDLIL